MSGTLNTKADFSRDSYLKLIEYEQICHTYKQLTGLAIIGLVTSSILAYLFWELIDKKYVTIFYFISIFTLTLVPLIAVFAFKKYKPTITQFKKWAKLLVFVYFIRSSTWTVACLFLYDFHTVVDHFSLFFTLAVIAVLHVISTSGYKPVFYASIYTLMIPFTVRLVIEFTGESIGFSLLVVFLTLLLILFNKRLHDTFHNSLILSHEKTQLADDLEKANFDKSRFLATASHDLRQPLHAQGLYIAELKHRLNDHETKNIVASLEKSTDVMRTMFDTLLDISKLDAGVIKPVFQHFPISQIFDDITLDFSGLALDKGLSFTIVDSSIIVYSDPILLSRIVRNLVSNAIKYTNKGGVVLGCRRKPDNSVSIEVCDSGIGVSSQEQEVIFQEYSQLDNVELDRNKGLGLGLAIVKRHSKLLDHPINIQSKPGSGSIFSILLTRGEPEKVDVSKKTFSQNHTVDLNNINILVIDDDAAILESMYFLLSEWGCEVETVESEQQAIRLVKDKNFVPDIIIADYNLRGNKNGVQAINAIKSEINENIQAILITGDTSMQRINDAENSGYEVLHKPLAPYQLRSLLSFKLATA